MKYTSLLLLSLSACSFGDRSGGKPPNSASTVAGGSGGTSVVTSSGGSVSGGVVAPGSGGALGSTSGGTRIAAWPAGGTAGPGGGGPPSMSGGQSAVIPQNTGGTLAATQLHHSGRLPVAAHSGTPAGIPYLGSPKLLFRDRTSASAGDVGGFIWLGNSGPLVLYASPDGGATWRWVEPPANLVIGTHPPQSLCQDATGKVHFIGNANGGAGVEYSRIALTHDTAGHISGYSAELNAAIISKVGYAKWAHIIDGVDGNGKPTLFYGLLIEQNGNGNRVVVGRTLSTNGLLPQLFSDWGDLSGTASVSVDNPATTTVGSGTYTAHNMDMGLAQNPKSKDLHVFSGVTNTGDMTPPTAGIQRWRYTPSRATWQLAGNAVRVAADAAGVPTWGSANSSPNYVWYTYFDGNTGMQVKRLDAAGNESSVPRPEANPTPTAWGWAALSVDPSESKLWAIWLRTSGAPGGYSIFSGFFNGASWTTFDETGSGYVDPWGLMGTVGWSNGLAVFSPDGNALPNGIGYPAFLYVISGGA